MCDCVDMHVCMCVRLCLCMYVQACQYVSVLVCVCDCSKTAGGVCEFQDTGNYGDFMGIPAMLLVCVLVGFHFTLQVWNFAFYTPLIWT